MEIIEGNKLAKLCDYSFGDHHTVWDVRLTGSFEVANISNAKFLKKCREMEGKVMSVFIDNIRLYRRELKFSGPNAQTDAQFIGYLMIYNNLLDLCRQFPLNKFVIFTSHEDTPITDPIDIPGNVLGIYGCNAFSTHEKVHPFPIGLQRQIGENDNRLEKMKIEIEGKENIRRIDVLRNIMSEPSKLLYINCGIERNPEREPLRKFETNDWCTTRFDKDSKFFPYDRYNEFLSELRDHKFVACPIGHGTDTHRVWETLYMRRVPIIKDQYMWDMLSKMELPHIKIAAWENMKEIIDNYGELNYEKAQGFDMSKLDLNNIFNNIMKQYGAINS